MCSCITSFILSKGYNVLVIVVDESREGARETEPHTDLIVLPLSCISVLLQTHQTTATGKNKHTHSDALTVRSHQPIQFFFLHLVTCVSQY